mgnify:CR=1 FL=1
MRPALILIFGCVLAGGASTMLKLSGAEPVTGAFFRCLFAMVPLGVAWAVERVRFGKLSRTEWAFGLLSGLFLALDYMLFNQAILDSGASIATVLIGAQVVVYPFLVWLIHKAPVAQKFILGVPVMLTGLALTAGLGSSVTTGPHPLRGGVCGILAGVFFAGYLYCNRVASLHDRRRIFTPVALGTFGATVTTAVVAPVVQPLNFSLESRAWVLLLATALLGQFLAFVLIGRGSANVSADTAASLLLVQPMSAVILGMVVLAERPTIFQFAGILLTLATVGFLSLPTLPASARKT